MAYNYKKLAEVDSVDTLGESANIIVEEEGRIKRVSKGAISGGSSGLNVLHINLIDNEEDGDAPWYSCDTDAKTIVEHIKAGGIVTATEVMDFGGDSKYYKFLGIGTLYSNEAHGSQHLSNIGFQPILNSSEEYRRWGWAGRISDIDSETPYIQWGVCGV